MLAGGPMGAGKMTKTLGPVRRNFDPWNDPSAAPFIELDGVTKSVDPAIAGIEQSLKIYEREFFALLGPAGAGKTALLRILAGLDEPDAGSVIVDGEDLAGVPPHRRPVNMMFRSFALFPHLSVTRNIAFGLKQERMSAGNITERVDEMLALFQLEDLARSKPHNLSPGQRQRVALARSLAKRPKVLLLDEPLAAFDRRLREEAQFELSNIQEQLGITFVIATDDPELAMTVADRIAVMEHGEITQVATPAEIYEAPATCYIADFIGDVNIFRSVVYDISGARVRLGIGIDRLVESESGVGFPPGAELWFAVRPEKISIAPATASAPARANQLDGKIWDIAYLGDMTVYHVRLEDGIMVRASQINSARAAVHPLGWDDPVRLTWPADAGLLLER